MTWKPWSELTADLVVIEAHKIACPYCSHGTPGQRCMRADGTRRAWPHQARRDLARQLHELKPQQTRAP